MHSEAGQWRTWKGGKGEGAVVYRACMGKGKKGLKIGVGSACFMFIWRVCWGRGGKLFRALVGEE